MFQRNMLLGAATFAGLASLALAAPLAEKRQTPSSCTEHASGYLIVRPTSNTSSGPITYAGIVSGVKHAGIDGQDVSRIGRLWHSSLL